MMSFKSKLACTLASALVALLPLAATADTTMLYLTRHAEKSSTGTDPALTPEGVTRAQNIAAMLKKANIQHIFSTNYVRTKQTAQPLGAILSLSTQTYDPSQLASFAQQLKALSGNALVVGHSDTTPDLIRQLGGDPGADIAETEFDRLYQIAVADDGSVTTTLFNSLPSVTVAPCAPVTMNQTNLSAAAGAWIYFTINVPECANNLTVTMSGGTGDGDLHVLFGSQPTATNYTCRPYKTGNAESCPLANPAAGVWHMGIKAYKAFTGVSLTAATSQ
jgi:phosphohistidine phosphatase SixA